MVLAISGLSRGLPTLFCGAFSRSFVAHLNLGQGGNLLSRSLHEGAYDHNPGFKRFIPFRPHPEFKKGDQDARQRLYQQLADLIWSDFASKQADFLRDVGEWVRTGRLKYREDIVDGLEKAPTSFIGMLQGNNFGKTLVRIAI